MQTRLQYVTLQGNEIYNVSSNSIPSPGTYVLIDDPTLEPMLLEVRQSMHIHGRQWHNAVKVFAVVVATGDEAFKQSAFCEE